MNRRSLKAGVSSIHSKLIEKLLFKYTCSSNTYFIMIEIIPVCTSFIPLKEIADTVIEVVVRFMGSPCVFSILRSKINKTTKAVKKTVKMGSLHNFLSVTIQIAQV